LFWDGIQLTEAAYQYVAAGWLSAISSPPPGLSGGGATANRNRMAAATVPKEFPRKPPKACMHKGVYKMQRLLHRLLKREIITSSSVLNLQWKKLVYKRLVWWRSS
jgi:hypothetical protein